MTSPADVHAAKLATIEAADDAPEALRERVARALWEIDADLFGWCDWEVGPDWARGLERRRADAAIATICTPVEGAPAGCGAEAALRRVLALARGWEIEARQWLDQASVNAGRGLHETALAQRDNASEQLLRACEIRAAAGGTA